MVDLVDAVGDDGHRFIIIVGTLCRTLRLDCRDVAKVACGAALRLDCRYVAKVACGVPLFLKLSHCF